MRVAGPSLGVARIRAVEGVLPGFARSRLKMAADSPASFAQSQELHDRGVPGAPEENRSLARDLENPLLSLGCLLAIHRRRGEGLLRDDRERVLEMSGQAFSVRLPLHFRPTDPSIASRERKEQSILQRLRSGSFEPRDSAREGAGRIER